MRASLCKQYLGASWSTCISAACCYALLGCLKEREQVYTSPSSIFGVLVWFSRYVVYCQSIKLL